MKKYIVLFTMFFALVFSGCGGGSSSSNDTTSKAISGYVIDDPVAGATIEVYDANGTLLKKKENATDKNGYFNIPYNNSVEHLILKAIKNNTTFTTEIDNNNKNIYVTHYTTALLNYDIYKNNLTNFQNDKSLLKFKKGIPTNKNTFLYKIIENIAQDIQNSYRQNKTYSLLNNKIFKNQQSVDLKVGSFIDFKALGYKTINCSNNKFLKGSKLIIDTNSSKFSCLAEKGSNIKLYNINVIPNNSAAPIAISRKDTNVTIRSIEIEKNTPEKISVIPIKGTTTVLKDDDNTVIANAIFDFKPDGLKLQKPLKIKMNAPKGKSFYLTDKDGTITKLTSVYKNGYYIVDIPHFSIFSMSTSKSVTTLTDSANINLNWSKIKNELLNKDKPLYSNDGTFYPKLLDNLKYTPNELKKHLDAKTLLATLILKDGKGMIEFTNGKLQFDGNIIYTSNSIKTLQESKTTTAIGSVLDKMVNISNKLVEATLNYNLMQKNHYNNKKELLKDELILYRKMMKESLDKNLKFYEGLQKIYSDGANNMKIMNSYIGELNNLYNESSRLNDYDSIKIVNTFNTINPRIKELEEKIINMKGDKTKFSKLAIAIARQEANLAKKMINQLKINFHINLANDHRYQEFFSKILNIDVKQYNYDTAIKTLGTVNRAFDDLSRVTGPLIIGITLFTKYYSMAMDYKTDQYHNKIKTLDELERVLPNNNKDIKSIKQDLTKWYKTDGYFNKTYLAFIDYATSSYSNALDSGIDYFNFASATYDTVLVFGAEKMSSLLGKSFAIAGGLTDLYSSFKGAEDNWNAANFPAYMSATASNLAFEAANNSKLSSEEQLKWYSIFQTISNNSLATLVYYPTILSNTTNSLLYKAGRVISLGASAISGGFAGAAVGSSVPVIGTVAGAIGGAGSTFIANWKLGQVNTVNAWSKSHNLTNVIHSDKLNIYMARNSLYYQQMSGNILKGLTNKKALIVPVGKVLVMPNGKKVVSIFVDKGSLNNLSIRINNSTSKNYASDLSTGEHSQAPLYYIGPNDNEPHWPNNKDWSGILVNIKKPTIATFVLGKDIKNIEILGWKGSIKDTVPYYAKINLSDYQQEQISENRINTLLNKAFNNTPTNILSINDTYKKAKDNGYTIIDLDTGYLATDKQPKKWIAIKYFNTEQYSVAFLSDGKQIYYQIRDYITGKREGDFVKLGNSNCLDLNHSPKEMSSKVKNSNGIFSATYIENLFPNLNNAIDNKFKPPVKIELDNEILIAGEYNNGYDAVRIEKTYSILDKKVSGYLEIWNNKNNKMEQKINFRQCSEGECSHDSNYEIVRWENSFSVPIKRIKDGNYTIKVFINGIETDKTFNLSNPTQPNTPPTAKIAISNTNITKGDTVTLDGSMSSDSDGKIVSYIWSDDKGVIDSCKDKSICKVTPDTTTQYTLKVIDDKGLDDNTTATVNVKTPVIPTTTLDVSVKPTSISLSPEESLNDKSITLYITTNADSSTCDVSINGASMGLIASQSACVAGSSGSTIKFDSSHEKIGTNTIKVTVTGKDGKKYSKSVSFNISKTSPTYTLGLVNETYPDNTVIKLSSVDKFTKSWTIKNNSNHSAHIILEKDKSKVCNINPLSTISNREEFDLESGESNKFIHNYTVPTKDGTYECYYKIKDSKGNYYTIGGSSDIWIKVKVQSNPLLANTDFNSEIKVGTDAIMTVQINNGNPSYNYNINWGDGEQINTSNSQNGSTFSHTYNSAGSYTVSVKITDKAGKSYSKTYTLKVSDKVSKTTSWSGYVDEVKTSGSNTGDIAQNITVTNEPYGNNKVNAYTIRYTKKADDKLYYTGYKLPVPQGLIKLDKKVRVTFVTKIDTTTGFWNYDREHWLKTDTKKYGAVIEDARDGLNDNGVFIVKDLLRGTRTDTNINNFIDFVVEDKGISSYALNLNANDMSVEKYAKNSDGNYTYTTIYDYPDSTGNYLSQIHIDFKGKGEIILAYLQYDKNGNGKFDKNESLILNTADKKVDWSKLFNNNPKIDNNESNTSTYKIVQEQSIKRSYMDSYETIPAKNADFLRNIAYSIDEFNGELNLYDISNKSDIKLINNLDIGDYVGDGYDSFNSLFLKDLSKILIFQQGKNTCYIKKLNIDNSLNLSLDDTKEVDYNFCNASLKRLNGTKYVAFFGNNIYTIDFNNLASFKEYDIGSKSIVKITNNNVYLTESNKLYSLDNLSTPIIDFDERNETNNSINFKVNEILNVYPDNKLIIVNNDMGENLLVDYSDKNLSLYNMLDGSYAFNKTMLKAVTLNDYNIDVIDMVNKKETYLKSIEGDIIGSGIGNLQFIDDNNIFFTSGTKLYLYNLDNQTYIVKDTFGTYDDGIFHLQIKNGIITLLRADTVQTYDLKSLKFLSKVILPKKYGPSSSDGFTGDGRYFYDFDKKGIFIVNIENPKSLKIDYFIKYLPFSNLSSVIYNQKANIFIIDDKYFFDPKM
jgi:hypothetical protein